jgi:hypothetical protein
VNRRALAAAAAALVYLASVPCFADDHVPVPYAPGEFPGWLSDVWRAEAVFVGVFPIALFVTLEVYDSYRYTAHEFAPQYAPWPFGSSTAASYSSSETLWLAVSALSLSLTVSGIDFLLGRIHAAPGD